MSAPPSSVMRPLTVDDIRTRLRDQVQLSYSNYAFFIKGAVVAASALSVILIVGTPKLPYMWIRLALWLATNGLSLITIATWARGSAFAGPRMNMLDATLPIATGLFEVILLLVIAPTFDKLPDDSWEFWYAALSLQLIFVVGLITNRLNQDREIYYAEELKPVFNKYVGWLRDDRRFAGGLCVFALVVFLVLRYSGSVFGPRIKLEGSMTTITNVTIGLSVFVFSTVAVRKSFEQQEELASL